MLVGRVSVLGLPCRVPSLIATPSARNDGQGTRREDRGVDDFIAGAVMACLGVSDPQTKAGFVMKFGGKVRKMLLT